MDPQRTQDISRNDQHPQEQECPFSTLQTNNEFFLHLNYQKKIVLFLIGKFI